jgi:N6-L-threonylcarbamoyladenine synthase
MKLLTLETTCDETAAAVVTDDLQVLGDAVASQDALHERFQGVVPEIAARAHVERVLPVIDEALRRAQIDLHQIDAVAVATTPGLAGSLLVGLVAAKALAVALDIPLIAVNHLHAHIYACRLASGQDVFPCVGLIVSGGHSNLYHCRSAIDFEYLGGTIDDAAGEAFDKVAKMLGLPFPGGPAISRVAQEGDRQAYRFPRSFLDDPQRLDFSFSGLKTAVRYTIAGGAHQPLEPARLTPRQVANIAASFEEAVVDCLVGKALAALQRTALPTLCVGGGVAANRRLRARLEESVAAHGAQLHIAPPKLCTDNAVMGAIAVEHWRRGQFADLDLDITPGLVRGG